MLTCFCGTAKNIFCTSFALLLRWSYFIFLIKRACSALVPGLLLHPIWFENMLVQDTTAGLNKACNIAYLADFVLILVREDLMDFDRLRLVVVGFTRSDRFSKQYAGFCLKIKCSAGWNLSYNWSFLLSFRTCLSWVGPVVQTWTYVTIRT